MACKQEHNLPVGVLWSRGMTEGDEHFYTPGGEYPSNLTMGFYTFACQHCDKPACVEVCPTGASSKREEDGIVLIDNEVCIGCGTCIQGCPYKGVRTLVEEPEWYLEFAVGDSEIEHRARTVEKCTFCVERIDRGERPACVDLCFAYARYFGDIEDPESEVSKVLAEREYDLLLPEESTGPNIYFLK
jgi:molybdopterin-containing oxidoreductase family iron-sulfur binding subunit